MISDADFPNVFPWMAIQETGRTRKPDVPGIGHNRAPWTYQECIARWQDDGGGARQRPRQQAHQTVGVEQQDLPNLGVLVPGLLPTLILMEASTGMVSVANILMRSQERACKKRMAIA